MGKVFVCRKTWVSFQLWKSRSLLWRKHSAKGMSEQRLQLSAVEINGSYCKTSVCACVCALVKYVCRTQHLWLILCVCGSPGEIFPKCVEPQNFRTRKDEALHNLSIWPLTCQVANPQKGNDKKKKKSLFSASYRPFTPLFGLTCWSRSVLYFTSVMWM